MTENKTCETCYWWVTNPRIEKPEFGDCAELDLEEGDIVRLANDFRDEKDYLTLETHRTFGCNHWIDPSEFPNDIE